MPTGKNKLKNSFSNSKSKMKEQKIKNSGKISRKKQIINLIIVCLALVISYALNVYTGSFQQANVKLLSLLFYSALGFIAFFILYYVVYFITLIRYNKRRKKIANSIISCDDNVAEIFAGNKHRFNYDKKIPLNDNLTAYLDGVLKVVKEIADGYSLGKNEYYYLNFTVYDAIKIVGDAVDGIDTKISPILRFLRAEDRPLKVVEKLLISALEEEKKEEKPKSALSKTLIDTAKKAGVSLIKTPLENALNDLTVFVGYEAFKVYGSSSKKGYLPPSKEVQNG